LPFLRPFSFKGKAQNTKRLFFGKEKQEEMRPGTFRECLTKTTDMYLTQFQRNFTVARQFRNFT
jgi:hypothetical protein